LLIVDSAEIVTRHNLQSNPQPAIRPPQYSAKRSKRSDSAIRAELEGWLGDDLSKTTDFEALFRLPDTEKAAPGPERSSV